MLRSKPIPSWRILTGAITVSAALRVQCSLLLCSFLLGWHYVIGFQSYYKQTWSCQPTKRRHHRDGTVSLATRSAPVLCALKSSNEHDNNNNHEDETFPLQVPVQSSSPVHTLTSTQEFLDCIDQAAIKELTIVLFHAHYCKVCQRSNIQYRKVAYRYPDIQFCRLETSHFSSEHLRSLGVTRLPFVQIYRNQICVASFSTRNELEKSLTHTIELCQSRDVLQWKSFWDAHQVEIAENRRARRALGIEPLLQGPLITMTQPHHLQRVLADASLDMVTVVLYHSKFVEACLRAQQQIRRIIEYYEDRARVQFARLEIGALTDDELRAMRIRDTPHVQVYRGDQLVESFATGPSYMFKRAVYSAIDKHVVVPKSYNLTGVVESI
jgi:hypothetical protein